MRLKSRLMVLLALALMGCTLPGYAGGDDGSRLADGLRLLEPEMGPLRVVTQKSQPTRFVLTTSLDLPTPGYRFTIDVVEIDKEAGADRRPGHPPSSRRDGRSGDHTHRAGTPRWAVCPAVATSSSYTSAPGSIGPIASSTPPL